MQTSETEPPDFEPCIARLGSIPEDRPSFVNQVNAVQDINDLRRMVIQKERERQAIANDLDVAARLGLVISETNEAVQIKLAHLEEENHLLREELERIHNAGFRYEPDTYDSEVKDRLYLTQELEKARAELTKFRDEMSIVSGQLNDMASEMLDSQAKVSMYAKRLAEVEHKLATTLETNTNLQILLEKALANQKMSSSATAHLVKNIQSDLSRVVSENDQLLARIAELESQQVESENRLAIMVDQAKEYASLLEQAQNTIHSLSEPRLSDDETVTNGTSTVLSEWDSTMESEQAKGTESNHDSKRDVKKGFENKIKHANELRPRIITQETIIFDHKKTQEGLKSILSDRYTSIHNIRTNMSASSSSSTQTSTIASLKKDIVLQDDISGNTYTPRSPSMTQTAVHTDSSTLAAPPTSTGHPITEGALRSTSFLTRFNDSGTEQGLAGLGATSFTTRGIPPKTSQVTQKEESSTATRFFRLLADRFNGNHDD